MKIALIGASGQLGTDFKKIIPPDRLIELNYPRFDITKKNEVKIELEALRPAIVINTAAYNLVDRAEEFPEEALAVNYFGVENLAAVCRSIDATLLHYSTDYVFGGNVARTTPYSEDDLPEPLNQYGLSKLKGELAVRKNLSRYFVIRTSGLFGEAGSAGKGGNFIESILKKYETGENLSIVNNQVLTPTYTLDLAKNSWELLTTQHYGLYHVTSEGQCSWSDFARAVFRHLDMPARIIPVKTDEYKSPARRPHYSVLENKHLNEIGLNLMRHWEATIPDYLREKKYLL